MQHNDEAAPLRHRVLKETDDNERRSLIRTLVDQWPEDPETRSLLHELVHTDASARIRESLVKLLWRRWPDERTCETLRRVVITDPEREVWRPGAWLLSELRPVEAMSWMHECLRSPYPGVRIRAQWALRTFWEEHPDTLTALHRVIATDDNPVVRELALRELDRVRQKNAVSHAVVRDRLAHDCSPDVRCAALRVLYHTIDPDAFDLVRDAAVDPDPTVRSAAVDALGKYRSVDRAATSQALYERVTTDEAPEVREAALRAMTATGDEPKLWPDHSEAVAWLREYVAADPFAESRRFARHLLGDSVAEPDIRALLHKIAEHHPDDEERCSAIVTLYLSERGDADTKEVIRRLAVTDPGWLVRVKAVELLDRWHDAPDTLELLCDRAVTDPDGDVRCAVWEALAYHSGRDDVADLMTRRAADDPDRHVRRQLLVEIVDKAQYAEDRTPTLAYLTTRAEQDPDPDVRQLAADLLADLTSGKTVIERRPEGTMYRWY